MTSLLTQDVNPVKRGFFAVSSRTLMNDAGLV